MMNQAFPVVEHNTFLTVYCENTDVPPRRCSSVPARLRSSDYSHEGAKQRKASDGVDSEAVTDVCTEGSDENASSSESGNLTEDGDALNSTVAAEEAEISLSPLAEPFTPAHFKTPLRSQAARWEPAAPAGDEKIMWRVGAPKNQKRLKWWQDEAADIVARMSCALGELEAVSRVECRKECDGWIVVAHCDPSAFYHFERIQTVAKQALMDADEASECICVLGNKLQPFQPTPMGFFASLGSMNNPKKACWDVYSKGMCPRGSACLWEHPAMVEIVNLAVVFGECAPC